VLISSVAFGLTCVSAWLGGKLVYRAKVGVDHSERFEEPTEWTAVLDADELRQHEPKRIQFKGKSILLYRNQGEIFAIGSVCSHAGGPLEEGTFHGTCVQCPWHDSVFDMRDGHIVHGPATSPQAAFETRVRDGQIELRLIDQDDETGE
jgi:nitrite reductase/ring-hydroxylating ferredoxin subunit